MLKGYVLMLKGYAVVLEEYVGICGGDMGRICIGYAMFVASE